MTSNKQEVLDRLSVIEREQVELRKAIEKFDQRSVFDIKNFSDVVEMAREKGYVWDEDIRKGEIDYEYAFRQLVLIAKVLNEGWMPTWSNKSEKKHYPWFSASSGFVFGVATYAYDCTHTLGGSRLCFKSGELAEFAGRTFTEIYRRFLMWGQ